MATTEPLSRVFVHGLGLAVAPHEGGSDHRVSLLLTQDAGSPMARVCQKTPHAHSRRIASPVACSTIAGVGHLAVVGHERGGPTLERIHDRLARVRDLVWRLTRVAAFRAKRLSPQGFERRESGKNPEVDPVRGGSKGRVPRRVPNRPDFTRSEVI